VYLAQLAPYFLFAFGLVFGSFGNVVIWRFPRGDSLSHPGSRCTSCGDPIAWYDNVPVLSWLALRARCRSCSAAIPWRYPAVELLSGVLWLLAWFLAGPTMALPFAVFFFYMLLLLAFIDLDTMRLPNTLVGLLAAVGAAGVIISALTSLAAGPLIPPTPGVSPISWALAGVLAGAGPALLMSVAYSAVRGSNGLGMGDVKLLAAMGLYLGPYAALVLFVGSVFGVLAAVLFRGEGGASRKIPFGPSLALAGVVVALWGSDLVRWYLSLL
jgi:leader peptidase (prepilin peptidase) / N-methyltransferase